MQGSCPGIISIAKPKEIQRLSGPNASRAQSQNVIAAAPRVDLADDSCCLSARDPFCALAGVGMRGAARGGKPPEEKRAGGVGRYAASLKPSLSPRFIPVSASQAGRIGDLKG
jgi:hypothetical protein